LQLVFDILLTIKIE